MVSQQLPATWEGSLPEFVAYEAFIRAGKQPGLDFTYQSQLMGGRSDKGGVIIDFLFSNPPDLAVNVQGVYYHYNIGMDQMARDTMARSQMAGLGVRLIFIDDEDLLQDPDYYVGEALRYQDHSRLGRG